MALNVGLTALAIAAKNILGDLRQTCQAVKERVDQAIREFDEALWDQAREVILGTVANTSAI